MDEIIIRGGRALEGRVPVAGAKNAALPILFASLLTEDPCTARNVPDVVDCRTALRLLETLGAEVDRREGGATIRAETIGSREAPYELVKTMRASFLCLGPLLARFGSARVSTPGGCAIGSRPVDLHLMGLEQMGAEIELSQGYVEASAPTSGLRGARIDLPQPSVGATENLMLAASLARGTTVIAGAAREPEIDDLAQVLASMGVAISGAGTSTIEIEGRESCSGFDHRVIPDRIEAGTFLMAVAAAGGDVTLEDAAPEHLGAVIDVLREAGVEIESSGSEIRVSRSGPLEVVDVETKPYPGFPTDLQAQLMALMCGAEGESRIAERIFENRFMHVQELVRMGADIRTHDGVAEVRGGKPLQGAPVMATDLRASVCLVVAGLCAQGETRLQRVYHLDRGYEHLERKLSALGAEIERVEGGGSAALPARVAAAAAGAGPLAGARTRSATRPGGERVAEKASTAAQPARRSGGSARGTSE